MHTMKAVIKPRPLPGKDWKKGFVYEERPIPNITKPTDVKFQVIAAAVCGTDVGIYHSKDSLRDSMQVIEHESVIVGHEFCGRIVDAGKDAREILAHRLIDSFKNGGEHYLPEVFKGKSPSQLATMPDFIDTIHEQLYATAEMHVTCGTCLQCLRGDRHVCKNTIIKGIHEDGCFTSYLTAPAENVIFFGKNEIPPDIIAFMDAIGNATHTVQAADVRGKRIAVLGCGVQGLMAIAVAKHAGATKIYATDVSHGMFTAEKLDASRFRLAREYGADETFNVAVDSEKERFYETVHAETEGAGVDAVLEMSGNYKAYEDAFRVVRMGGMMALLGIPGGKMIVDFSKDIIFPGVTVHGVIGRRVFSTWDMMRTLLRDGLADKFIDTGFITHDIPLHKVEEGINAIANGDGLKVLLRPGAA
jgi:threonine 3-dehydrogenase